MSTDEIPMLKCQRCGGKWQRRTVKPLRCPRCGSFYWEDTTKMKQPNRHRGRRMEVEPESEQSKIDALRNKLGR